MTITYHTEFEQGSGEWIKRRCGLLTASEFKNILTPTLKIASNDKERSHLFELLAQRVNNYVEPQYLSDAMLRGEDEEIAAREKYSDKCAKVEQCAFITNDKLGFTIGYSPDGLVGDDGQIEIKSRNQKYQVQTIIEGKLPEDFALQIHVGLFVSERSWCDFISYSNGMPMFVLRVLPDPVIAEAITNAAVAFEQRLQEKLAIFNANSLSFLATERRDYQEITL